MSFVIAERSRCPQGLINGGEVRSRHTRPGIAAPQVALTDVDVLLTLLRLLYVSSEGGGRRRFVALLRRLSALKRSDQGTEVGQNPLQLRILLDNRLTPDLGVGVIGAEPERLLDDLTRERQVRFRVVLLGRIDKLRPALKSRGAAVSRQDHLEGDREIGMWAGEAPHLVEVAGLIGGLVEAHLDADAR